MVGQLLSHGADEGERVQQWCGQRDRAAHQHAIDHDGRRRCMQHADLAPELGIQLARLLHARLHARAQLLKLCLMQLFRLLCHQGQLEPALAGLLLR
jgi:hypothetical protein